MCYYYYYYYHCDCVSMIILCRCQSKRQPYWDWTSPEQWWIDQVKSLVIKLWEIRYKKTWQLSNKGVTNGIIICCIGFIMLHSKYNPMHEGAYIYVWRCKYKFWLKPHESLLKSRYSLLLMFSSFTKIRSSFVAKSFMQWSQTETQRKCKQWFTTSWFNFLNTDI